MCTLLGTNISHQKSLLSRCFSFSRLVGYVIVPWRVVDSNRLHCWLRLWSLKLFFIDGKIQGKPFFLNFAAGFPQTWRRKTVSWTTVCNCYWKIGKYAKQNSNSFSCFLSILSPDFFWYPIRTPLQVSHKKKPPKTILQTFWRHSGLGTPFSHLDHGMG